MRGITTLSLISIFLSPKSWGAGRLCLVFTLIFFGFCLEGVGQVSTTPPVYTWLSEQNLPTVNVNLIPFNVNTEDITISVATDPEGNVYTLTFGKGVAKRSSTGALINASFIPANQLDSPLDLAIDKNGFIYVADYLASGETFEDNGKIKVFSPQGIYLPFQTILTSFYRPLGVEVDEQNVYVAEFNDGSSGPERNQLSRIRIYDKISRVSIKETSNVNTPFRIAIDSQKKVYVSQAGNSSPSVRIYDQNLNYLSSLPNMLSPGSIVIDPFDYIHVIEYDGRIDFSKFINFESLTFSQIQTIAKSIDDGQKVDAFSIKVFDKNRILKSNLKNQIDFPVDLTFNGCDRMYVNNAEIFGGNVFLVGYVPSKMEFDLEIYKRTPSLDIVKPTISCTSNIVVTAPEGASSMQVNYAAPSVSDLCSTPAITRNGPGTGSQFVVGTTTTIEFTATDAAGNFETCSFTVTVKGQEVPLDITCPPNQTGQRDQNCRFTVPDYTMSATVNKTGATVTQFPVAGSIISASTTVLLTASLNGETDNCNFVLTLIDRILPVITCPGNQQEIYDPSTGFTLPDYKGLATATDNCLVQSIIQSPAPGTVINQNTQVTLRATDTSGNFHECTFTVELSEEVVLEITCPGDQTGSVGANCQFTVPDYTTSAQVNKEGATITQNPAAGAIITSDTPVTLTAKLGDETDTCVFQLILEDVTDPVITCPGNQTETYNPSTGFTLPDYSSQATASDNCAVQSIIQNPPPGTVINQNTLVTLRATDTSGNFHECTFTVELSEEVVLEITCPADQTGTLGANCQFTVPDYTTSAQVNKEGATITQNPAAGAIITSDTPVTLTAKLGDETDTCVFQLILEDVTDPVITCPGNQTETYNPSTGFTLPDYSSQATASDNCAVQSLVQSPAPGTVINQNTQVILRATDTSGNFHECTFTVELSEEMVLDITCPADQTGSVGANCQFTVPDYTTSAQVNKEGATITQNPAAGAIIISDTPVTLTAKLGDETDTCVFQLILEDVTDPVITCPGNQSETYNPSTGFTLPDYSSQATASDNCAVQSLVQSPAPGTVINQNTQVTLRATDTSGNFHECTFTVELSEEMVLDITCPADQTGTLGANCQFTVPDYTTSAQVNKEGATITQNPAAGAIIISDTPVTLTAKLGDETDTCVFQLILEDVTDPVITCPGNQTETYNPSTGFTLPDYSSQATASDNCAVQSIVQSPAPGTVINQNTLVTLRATDTSGNFHECTFTVELSEEVVLEITCPGDQTGSVGANCQFTVPDYTTSAQVNKEGATITQNPAAGAIITSDTPVTLTAKLGDETDTCVFQLILEDVTDPVITCPGNQTETYNPSTGFTLPDYSSQATASDNCAVQSIIQNPPPGTVINQNTLVTLRATDTSGNFHECTFTVELSEEVVLEITCPADQTGTLGANCQFTVPDYTTSAQVNKEGATITQNPAAGAIITSDTPVTLTAKLGDETDTCVFQFILEDVTDPVITCPGNQTETYNPSTGFTLPDYSSQATASDNCLVQSIIQSPAPGTVINQNTQVTLRATDTSGNFHECTFTVELSEEVVLDITCPGDQTGPVGENCLFTMPDYTSSAQVNKEGATITQEPAAGTVIRLNTPVTLTAKFGDETDTCVFQLILIDVTDPVIICPGDQFENYDPATGLSLQDYRGVIKFSDNCEIQRIIQSPPSGTIVNQNTRITITATDTSGNTSECSFMLTLSEEVVLDIICPGDQTGTLDEKCQYTVPDYTTSVQVNFAAAQISQNPPPGTLVSASTSVILTATLNGRSDMCSFNLTLQDNIPPVASCGLAYQYRLNQNGILTISADDIDVGSTDNCGIVLRELSQNTFNSSNLGDNSVTLTVTDAAGNSDSCETNIEILPFAEPGSFTCKDQLVLQLDQSGKASLTASELYTGNAEGATFEISRSEFTCQNLGMNTVTLNYTANGVSATCEIAVMVRDNIPPVINAVEISIFLDASGRANITPQMLDNGTADNCGSVTLSININSFACKDLGRNEVLLTATDGNGNSASATTVVTVLGNCGGQPPVGPDVEYIFIYPNPTAGPFTIATPRGVKITRVEVFDFRGRFIVAKENPEDISRYSMELMGVESAVYMLKLFTTDGLKFLRVIIR